MQVLDSVKQMSPERFLALYQSLEHQGFGPLDDKVAAALRFRPQAIRKLPMDQRARQAKRILELSANTELAYELLGAYLIKNCKGLVTEFLDATGVKHEDGMIEDIEASKPATDKVNGAVAELDKKFKPEDVTLYLAIAAEQWPGVKKLDELWRSRG